MTADLDSGAWTARFKEADSGTWIPLTQDGTGLDEITDIQCVNHRLNDPWGDASLGGGTRVTLMRVAGIGLSAPEVVAAPSTTDIAIQGSNWGANNDATVSGTFTDLTGDSDQIGSNDVIMQIAADLNTGNWSSRYKVGAGNWVSLVTDGTGITDVNRLQLTQKHPMGILGDGYCGRCCSDFIKVDSLRVSRDLLELRSMIIRLITTTR